MIYLPAARGGRVLPLTEVGDVGYEPVVDLVECQSLVWRGEDGLHDRLSEQYFALIGGEQPGPDL